MAKNLLVENSLLFYFLLSFLRCTQNKNMQRQQQQQQEKIVEKNEEKILKRKTYVKPKIDSVR